MFGIINLPEQMSKLEFKIAGRYLRARKKEGFASVVVVLSFLGIMLGVATLIVTMAVMNGVKTELINRIIGINAHVSVGSFSGSFDNYGDLVNKIENIDGVTQVNPAVQGQALAVTKDDNIGLAVKGILKEDLQNKKILSSNILAGKIFENESFGVLVGSSLARQAALSEGEKLKLLSPNFSSSFFGSIPRILHSSSVAIFSFLQCGHFTLSGFIFPQKKKSIDTVFNSVVEHLLTGCIVVNKFL